jgi:integrase/recombinase XerD
MREQPYGGESLFGPSGSRKYLNTAERLRFVRAAHRTPCEVRLFCLILRWSGARISEILALTPASFDIESGVVAIETLKRRRHGVIRQVPLPFELLHALDESLQLGLRQRDATLAVRRIWRWSRTTAWRRVKETMNAAGIDGSQAMPKGLRHGFGVNAFQASVPPHLVQRWLGHASARTTAIYADVVGPDERAFAARMWSASPKSGRHHA